MPAKKLKLTAKREAWAAKQSDAPTFKGEALQHNAAVSVRYVQALSALTAQMTAQTKREILALFKTDAAASHFGQDATIASQSRILLADLGARFNALFAKKAKPLADTMVRDADKSGTTALHSSLRKLSGGMSLKTSVVNSNLQNIYKASVAENVSLIKSIASEYLQKVEGAVMRSITTGNGLQDLVPALEQFEGQTHRRAKNIALDQTRKVMSSINRGRMEALGVNKFMWHHSGGGAHPRQDHVDMDGQIYSFDKLPVIDPRTGERGIPGQAPNCFPGDTLVDLQNGCNHVWRYLYEGDIFALEIDGVTVRSTPNHPFLTLRGWVAAKDLELSDHLIQAKVKRVLGVENDIANTKATIEQVFFAQGAVLRESLSAAQFDFHGDRPDSPVEHVVPDNLLALMANVCGGKSPEKQIFSGANADGIEGMQRVSPALSGCSRKGLQDNVGAVSESQAVGLTSTPKSAAVLSQNAHNDLTAHPEFSGDSLHAATGVKLQKDSLGGDIFAPATELDLELRDLQALSAEALAEIVRIDQEKRGDFPNGETLGYHLVSVGKKSRSHFVGHVYTLESNNGWFQCTLADIVTKNCRCTMSPVFQFDKE